ncbi:MAG: MotA/TolQ/ExbB proton channel family protein, partial [Polyangiaceae bacterium]|nr:MotA/TolQ/ExbB proton channel family protein [Polyangiaceae bacterium]
MAVALLTTMYGAIVAFVICNPIAEKLQRRSQAETMNMNLVIEGVDSIAKGHNASVIRDKLEARLQPKDRRAEEAA